MTPETLPRDFDRMVNWIGAVGDFDPARRAIATVHIATPAEV